MSNRIVHIQIEPRSLDPVAAELLIRVALEQVTPTTEVRGRLMGPSCPYASTVEIAYALQIQQRESNVVICRVVIPEASLWDTQSPFLYIGPVEVWQDGQRCDRQQVRFGLRQFTQAPGGLRINGKPVTLNGVAVENLDETTARQLRADGRNLLVVPLREDTLTVWAEADRWGFVVLGRSDDTEQSSQWQEQLRQHASCLGWLAPDEDWQTRYA